jgi:hypothetical protein
MRVEKEGGELVLPSADGKVWIFPAASIVAVAFEHRLGVPGRKAAIELGFHGPQR